MTVPKFKRIKYSEKDRCSNCSKLFDGPCGIANEGNKISWYDRMNSAELHIRIVDVFVVVFEGLLKMNKTRIGKAEEIFMCYDCLYNVSELYRNYREFMSRTIPTSFVKRLFPHCILWPEKLKTSLHIPNTDPAEKSLKIENFNVFTEEAENEIEPPCEKKERYNKSEVKIENDDESEDFDNDNLDNDLGDSRQAEDSDTDQEPSVFNNNDTIASETATEEREENLAILKDRCHRKIQRDPSVVQLPNGKWYIPKTGKVLLHKYIPGRGVSLDLGKSTELLGRTIKISGSAVLKIPKNRIHFYQFRAKQKPFKRTCTFCRENFTEKELYDEHVKKHQEAENKFECAKCGKEHVSAKSLWNHTRTTHIEKKTYACITCGASFPLISYLKTHIYDVHVQSNEERTLKSKIRTERNRRNAPKKRDSSKDKKWLDIHPGEINRLTCEYCGKVLSTPHMKFHHVFALHKPESERPFGCSYCERRFITKGLLEAHEKAHLGINKNHPCGICGKGFSAPFYLKKHVATHSEERPFVCKDCGKGFKDKIALRKHIRVIHEIKEKTHECDICKARFKTQDSLKTHRKLVHETEHTCLCFECGIKLKNKIVLQKHLLGSHGINAESVCDICKRGFPTKNDYEEHVAKGYHLKPLWMRPESERKKRNYNVPSYVRAKVQKKLDRNIARREKEGLPPLSESEKESFIQTGMESYGVGTEPLRKRKRPGNYDNQQSAPTAGPSYYN